MNSKWFFIVLVTAVVVIAANSVITALNTITFSSKKELFEILQRQGQIERKLFAIETQQATLLKIFGKGLGEAPPLEDFSKQYAIPQGQSAVAGKKTASITIVEFSDLQCPFSQRFHTVIGEVLEAYPNDVNFMFKHFPLPFHQQAKPAAKAVLAAGLQNKGEEMLNLLFQNQKELTEEKFKQLAGQLGLDVERFLRDYRERDAEWEKIIADDIATANAADVRGTPTFFINGRKTKSRDLASFKAEIDQILSAPQE